MAKMFYTLEETKNTLGKSEDEIRQFARDGRLREFRDGPRLMFKADQVDQLHGELGGGDVGGGSGLGPSDSGLIGLGGDSGLSGSGTINLMDSGISPSPSAGLIKEDTALAMDLGLSGTVGGVPSPLRGGHPGAASGTGLSGTASGRGGITVFDIDEGEHVDPSAQTAIGGSDFNEQVNLEGVGSGSGLLDLTRESDDTSLGAQILDEFVPPTRGGRPEAVSDTGMMDALPAGPTRAAAGRGGMVGAPVYVEAHDALAPAFGALALFGALLLAGAGFVVANAVFGVRPDIVAKLSGRDAGSNPMMYLLMAVGGALVFFVVGWIIGKAGGSRR